MYCTIKYILNIKGKRTIWTYKAQSVFKIHDMVGLTVLYDHLK